MALNDENLLILEKVIFGRVKPSIYAFSTNTVPNFLKVGDTFRPVQTRMNEWRRVFPDLVKVFEDSATINDEIYFRDFAVHDFLENDLGKPRLKPSQIAEDVYYSREFFSQTSQDDIKSAIDNIAASYEANAGRYDFYDTRDKTVADFHYLRGEEWTPRPNQQAVIDRFVHAVETGRNNLLMYAVMRFGKSFTSLCCAKSINCQTVVVVSAKADVKAEWKKTVEIAGNFDKHVFLSSDDLLRSSEAIQKVHENGDCAVVFLTLQDLQGGEIKEKHKEIFDSKVDLLIVDETHFGARAAEYGRALQDVGQAKEDKAALKRGTDDEVDGELAEDQIKVIDATIRLHLSGTPYRILMGSEFEKEDVIAFVQFSDVVREQSEWDERYLNKDEVNEWDNPYFGFPQMVRFAFNPNKSSLKKMQELRGKGATFAMSALLEPKSISYDSAGNEHKLFLHEDEIFELLGAIDGSDQDEGILSFLDYDRIKDGGMCRHMVMVLPYCASCDAMQNLIEKRSETFKNLADYKIINISGVEGGRDYKNPEQVKQTIAKLDEAGEKTLTLTVNRMLTGSTVEQWDTMLFLKDTSSPQEYDQATFRLQNQFTRDVQSQDGNDTLKENLKPQTLLVDFDPLRLFKMQEQKSLIYNANVDDSGNAKLAERLTEELLISPIITMDRNKIRRVEAANILDAISEYNSKRSIADEAREIPVDLGLLQSADIRRVIEAQAELGSSAGLTMKPFEGDGDDIEVDASEADQEGNDGAEGATASPNSQPEEDLQSLEKKLQTYYQRILFFSMLSPTSVSSLADIVTAIEEPVNHRIASNLSLDLAVLKEMLAVFDPFKLNGLDYKIQNISSLVRDETLSPVERASRALNKFTRISNSEVRTPPWVCNRLVGTIPADELKALIERGEHILDIASKSGEFALAFYERLTGELGLQPEDVRGRLYSIPTSAIAYEFTRFFYDILELDTQNIAAGFDAYDLVSDAEFVKSSAADIIADARLYSVSRDDVLAVSRTEHEEGQKLKFGTIVGNPPYQESDGGAQASARPIYHKFVNLAKELEPDFMTFIIPTRWYLGGKGLEAFREEMITDTHMRELHDYLSPEVVFPGTNNRGGICHFLRDISYDAKANGTRILTYDGEAKQSEANRPLNTFEQGVFLRDSVGVGIVGKVMEKERFEPLSKFISPRKPFGLDGSIVNTEQFAVSADDVDQPVLCYGKGKKVGYVGRDTVKSHTEWIDRWKVLTPYANNIGTELNDDNQNAFVAPPGSVCSETFIYIGVDIELNAKKAANLVKYLKTRFARFLHSQAKISQHGTKATYRFVPTPDFSAESEIDWGGNSDAIDEHLFKLYGLEDEEREHIKYSINPM